MSIQVLQPRGLSHFKILKQMTEYNMKTGETGRVENRKSCPTLRFRRPSALNFVTAHKKPGAIFGRIKNNECVFFESCNFASPWRR